MNKKVDLKSILILDDDVEFRKLLKSLLSEYFQGVEFYEYDPVEKGEPADDFDWSKFDVLILDYYLCVHGLNGLDLFQKNQIKANFPPTIMLTGAGNEELAIRVLKSGIKDYIRKDKLNTAMLAEAITNAYEENHVERNEQGKLQEVNAEIAREIDQLRRMKSEAEEQVQKERAEHSAEVAALRAQLEGLEEEKQTHQDAADDVQKMKNEAKELISKEYSALTKRTTVLRMQSQKIEKQKEKIKKTVEKLLLEKEKFLAEKRNHAEEMAKAKKELENDKRELVAAKTKQKTAKEEKHGKHVKLPDEKVTNEKTIKSDQFDDAIDPDELLDQTQILHKQKKNVIEEKTEVIETHEKVIDFDLSGESVDPDELLDPSQELYKQKKNVIEEKAEVIETRKKDFDSDPLDKSIDPDELIDPTQKSNNQKNGSGQDEDS